VSGTLLLCLLYLSASLQAAPREMKLRWSELSGQITGHTVTLTLPDGHYVEGHVTAVQPDALQLNVNKTSDRQAIPKGKLSAPRSSISRIGLKTKTVKGRTTGVGVGLAVAGGLIGAGAIKQGYEGLGLAIIGGIVGVAVMIAGFFIGNDLDRQITMITVTPD